MPLIRALRAWIGRRMAVPETTYGTAGGPLNQENSGAAAMFWLVLVAFALPLIALIVLIGLTYEAILRIDRGKLSELVRWAISSAVGIGLVGLVTVAVLYRL